jgi:hypothetical protein
MDRHFRAHHDGIAVLAGIRPDDREISRRAARSHELHVAASARRAERRREWLARMRPGNRWSFIAGLTTEGSRRISGAPTR